MDSVVEIEGEQGPVVEQEELMRAINESVYDDGISRSERGRRLEAMGVRGRSTLCVEVKVVDAWMTGDDCDVVPAIIGDDEHEALTEAILGDVRKLVLTAFRRRDVRQVMGVRHSGVEVVEDGCTVPAFGMLKSQTA
jgi:hypothetical protein